MNNKIVSVVLVAGIAATGFAGISAASETSTGSFLKWNTEIKELFQKAKSGVELTAEQQATLDEAKANRGEKGAKHGGKRKGGGNLTDDEKTSLEAMSDEEKQAFFDVKKEEMKAQKEATKGVVDALIAGDTLTANQEATRLEMIAKMSDTDSHHKGKGNGEWKEIIAKILAGDELSADEETQLADMQAKRSEREAQKAIMEPIKAKLDAGEELSDEEQATFDDYKANKPEGKGKGKGNKGSRADRSEK